MPPGPRCRGLTSALTDDAQRGGPCADLRWRPISEEREGADRTEQMKRERERIQMILKCSPTGPVQYINLMFSTRTTRNLKYVCIQYEKSIIHQQDINLTRTGTSHIPKEEWTVHIRYIMLLVYIILVPQTPAIRWLLLCAVESHTWEHRHTRYGLCHDGC